MQFAVRFSFSSFGSGASVIKMSPCSSLKERSSCVSAWKALGYWTGFGLHVSVAIWLQLRFSELNLGVTKMCSKTPE